jgi:uncharacterized protein YndB with AHSA1/START domain
MAKEFRIERSTTINAEPGVIYAQLANFHHWRAWSPYEDLDPNLKRTYSGPESGVGAVYGWSGKLKAGSGQMTIAEAVEPERLRINLDFTKPFKAHNVAEFTIAPSSSGGANTVTWAMTGPPNLLMRLLSPIFNMDKMVGKAFEKGLANLKRVTEEP